MAYWQAILSIKQKRTPFKEMSYLTTEGVQALLEQPDLSTRKGRRDFILMGLLYDSGARVQEIINLTPENIRLGETTTVKLHGKGNKIRVVPLSTNQVKNLRLYMEENNLLLHNIDAIRYFLIQRRKVDENGRIRYCEKTC